ncbi:MAG: DNA polymerase III subunit alpha [Myxococcales bacterium]|nr:DNA polymerase III subunit alpha [Myxococcales bacterium]
MSATPFVHLHLHSQYSLLDGAIKINPLFDRAKALGMPAVGLTDHGNLFGVVEFYEAAHNAGVKPIIGCEVYVASGSRHEKEKRATDSNGFDAISHLLLLAMNEQGYKNLMYLVSKGYLEGFYYKPRIDLDLLRTRSGGLIATSGCLSSMVSRAIIAGQSGRAWELVEDFSEIFKDRFYLELQRHGIDDQDRVNAELVKMSIDMKLPMLATNDCHYLDHEDHAHHDALLCIGTGTNLDDVNRFKFDGKGFFLKSGDEMAELFRDHPSALQSSLDIADRCDLEIGIDTGQYHMPEYQVPAGKTREDVLGEQAWAGLRGHLGLDPDEPLPPKYREYEKRMEHELGVINSMGFAGYFLIVADFIQYAKRENIPVGPGRGSSAGSLAAYGLGITGVDPIEYDIIFERFLNPERISMPDIDVDFCMRGRDQVIRYVQEKYDQEGDDGKRVAQIITFGKLQARAAIRDVGRVLGMAYGDVDRIAKLVPDMLGISLAEALEQSPEMRSRADADGQVTQLLETAQRLEGLTRHASTHAAGVVISTKPLIESVPLYRDPKSGDVITQFDMRCIEKIGLIKFDFLGLKTLTTISDASKRVREHMPDFDIEKIPNDDSTTYDLLASGNTESVFQVESGGMTDLVTKLRPRLFKELIPIVALYRPGPLGSGMVEDFVRRKNGLTKIEYLLPELEELTSETLGVIVYQDQVLQIAKRLAGYSLGEADLLRRAMGKKKKSEMNKQRERFVSGCVERSIDKEKAEEVFTLMAEFAGYGFPKAHSTAYALITYQTAYLKANHTREYLAAVLTTEAGNNDKLARYIAHAQQLLIPVLPPDINESARDFTVVEEGIRFGLAGVKNVGEGAIESVVEARGESGHYTSLYDFAARIDGRRINRRVVESLVKCGAFDSLHPNRASVWAGLNAALEAGASAQRDREVGQESLFGGDYAEAAPDPALPETAEWTDRQRLEFEKEVLSFYVTGHPLGAYAPVLARFADMTGGSSTEGREGREVRAGGLITQLRETRTRRGALMAFGTLEDLEGTFDLVIFSEPYVRYGTLLKRAASTDVEGGPVPLLVSGQLEAGEKPKLLVNHVWELDKAEEQLSTQLRLTMLATEATLDRLQAVKKLLAEHPGDCAVALHLIIPDESETVMSLGGNRVRPSPNLRSGLDGLFGRGVTELEP